MRFHYHFDFNSTFTSRFIMFVGTVFNYINLEKNLDFYKQNFIRAHQVLQYQNSQKHQNFDNI